MSDVKWIKITTDLFDDEKIKYIETLPNGDETIVIWFRLMCLAGRSNSSGFLMLTEKVYYTEELLSSIFRRDIKSVQLALSVFESLDMIEIIDNKIYLSNWEKHQNAEAMNKLKEQTKDRVARHREKQLALHSVTSALQDRYSNATELELEKEEDKELEKINRVDCFLGYSLGDTDLYKSLKDFEKMRKSSKKPLTDRAKELLCIKLDELKAQGYDRIECLNNSIMNNWQGVFAPKEVKSGKRVEPIPEYSGSGTMTKEEIEALKERIKNRK